VNQKEPDDMKEQNLALDLPESIDTRKPGQILKQILGYAIALACLIWVFHDIHPERLFEQIGKIAWGWVILGLILDFFSYLSQGYRWHLLLTPVGDVPVIRTAQAIYTGLFTNEILPFRTGELVRAYLVSRWKGISFVNVVPSIMVERFFDAIWLGVGVGLTALLVDLPKNLMRAADILGVVVLVFIAMFIWLVIRQEQQLEKNEETAKPRLKMIGRLIGILNRLANGIKTLGASRSFYFGLLVSPLFLIFQILAFWFIMKGYGIELNLWSGAAIMMIQLLGIAIPNAPSNVGTYQFFTVVGLTLFNIDKTTASGFSVVAFIVLTLPLWILGSFALLRTGMKLKEIRAEISGLMKRKEIDK
jgi:glycosyltransferase 2 family protein